MNRLVVKQGLVLVLKEHKPDELQHLPARDYLFGVAVLAQVVGPILELCRQLECQLFLELH